MAIKFVQPGRARRAEALRSRPSRAPMGGLIDAVLFDAGGVLVLPDPTVLGPCSRRYGGDPPSEDVTCGPTTPAWPCQDASRPRTSTTGRPYDEAYVRAVGVAGPDDAGGRGRARGHAYAVPLALPDRRRRRRRCADLHAARRAASAWSRTPPARSRACWPHRACARSARATACRCACVVDSARRRRGQARSGHLRLRPRRARPAAGAGRPTSATRCATTSAARGPPASRPCCSTPTATTATARGRR